MRKFYSTIVLLLSVSFALNTMGQRAFYGEQQRADHHILNMRFGDIIYDQSEDEEYGGYIVSQFFTDAASADLSSEAADDFVVPEGETWVVGSFGVWGTWWAGSQGNPEKINVAIYENDGGQPGELIHGFSEQTGFYAEEWTNQAGELQSYYNFTFPAPITFTQGHYWISFQVHDSYDVAGQWGWEDKTNTNWEPWHWRNPGGGHWNGGPDWKPSTMIHWFGYALDNRFALYGEAYDNDVAMVEILSPASGTLTSTESVTIKIKNQGLSTQTGFEVAYSVNGGAWVNENVGALEITSEATAEFTFTTTADLSATGFYTIAAKTMLTGDEQPANDATEMEIVNYGEIYPMVNYDTVEVTTCSGTFTDMGGVDGMIMGGDNGVITIYPAEAGKKVKMEFFGIWDISHTTDDEKPFQVFDGPDMNSPLIGEWTQNDWRDFGLKPDILKALSQTGAMTIRYYCPEWDQVQGWTANVSCYEQPEDDFEVTQFVINPTLLFTNRDINFTATVRNIGSIAQAKEITFYVNDMAVGAVNTGLVQPTGIATVEYVHQFDASGAVALKAGVPEDSGDTPENNHLTIENYVYENGWFVEMFDDGYFPPEDWTPGPFWGGSTSGYNGSPGAAFSNVDTYSKDTLVSPKLVIHQGDLLTFYAATSLWWQGNLEVIWKNATTGVWQSLQYIDLAGSPQYKPYQIDVSAAAGENYIGFVNVADVPTSWSGQVLVDHVVGIGIEFFYFDNDMKMSEFNPVPTPSKNEPIALDVTVKNNGHNAMQAGDYNVKIMMVADGGDTEMASLPGIACNHLQEKTHTLTVTFPQIGPAEIYAVVELNGDEKPDNNQSIIRPVYVQVNGTNTVQVGNGDVESWEIPSPLGTAWAVSEVIYPADLINPDKATGYITGIAYEFNNSNTTATLDVPVQIYIGETDKENLAEGFINGTLLEKVAETRVDLQVGLNQQLYIPFTAPYDYQGGNLCVLFFKPYEDYYPGVQWLVTEMDDDSISAFSTSWYPPLDPLNLREAWPNWKNHMPNTAFYIADVGIVSLNGVVTDTTGAPMENVKVEAIGFENYTMTLADGSYELSNLLAWENVIKASKYGYYNNSQNIILMQDINNMLNFEITPLPVVTINAMVVGNDDPMHYLEGAAVTLEGYENYSTTVSAEGTFEIPGVFGDKTYTLTISYPGFETYSVVVDVAGFSIDMGTITLTEMMLIPFYTQAVQTNPGTVQVTWNAPPDGVKDVLTWDYLINNGYTAEVGEEVWLGNIYEMAPGTITKVSLFWAQYGATSGTVQLDLVDLDGNVFYSSESFQTVQNGWTHVDVPNLTFEGGQFLAMAYWDGTNPELTDYLAADEYEEGINFAYIMYPGATAYPLSDLLELDITFQIDVEIVTDAPEAGRYNQGYNIFAGPYSDINNWQNWEKINAEPVMGNSFLDTNWPQPTEGFTFGVQAVYTTGVSDISFSIPIVHDPNMPCEQPWTYIQTGQVHNISIPATADVNIFGEPLVNGDWIGVFYLDDNSNEVCGGAGVWGGPFGNGGAVVNAYGDDLTTPEKDGFAAGETFRWRMHDCNTWEEYPAGATYNPDKPNQGQFADFGLSALTSLQVMFCQYYTLSQGWNSLSAYIIPGNTNVVDMFAPIVNNLTIIRNLSQVYWPEENINTMIDFDNNTGYVAKFSSNVDFEICGAQYAGNTVTLNAGWHYLPVLSDCDVDAMEFFGPLMDDIVVVQELIGLQVFWPKMSVFTLQQLTPGKAYRIKTTAPITFTFPDCAAKAPTSQTRRQNHLISNFGNIEMTPHTQLVIFSDAALKDLQQGDIITAFGAEEKAFGVVEINSGNRVITLFGDDGTGGTTNGYHEGEQVSYRLFRAATGETFDLEVAYDLTMDNATGTYQSNTFAAITKSALFATGVENLSSKAIDMYPNPASEAVNFSFAGNENETVSIEIFDVEGCVMATEQFNSNTQINTADFKAGIYFVKISTRSATEVRKLVIR
jgi:hypothetical protein